MKQRAMRQGQNTDTDTGQATRGHGPDASPGVWWEMRTSQTMGVAGGEAAGQRQARWRRGSLGRGGLGEQRRRHATVAGG